MKRQFCAFLLFFSTLTNTGLAADFLCKTMPGADIATVAASLNATVVESLPESRLFLLSAPSMPAQMPAGVEYIEVPAAAAIPKQSFAIVSKDTTSGTHAWYSQQPAMQMVNLPAALAISQGRRIVIADINSAVDYGHPALIGHLIAGHDFIGNINSGSGGSLDQSTSSYLDQSTASYLDQSTASYLDQATASYLDQSTASYLDQSTASYLDMANPAHGHGTLVAGIIAAMAPQAMIMPLRAFDDSGNGDSSRIVRAIRYAVKNGAHVINMSFGLSGPSRSIANAIEYAERRGVIVVASAGNQSSNVPQFPAAYPHVIAVAATTIEDAKASFSNYGVTVDVTAPGANIISAYPGGLYAVVSGTSFAAPMVAAEAGLLLSHRDSTGENIVSGTVNIDAVNADYLGQLGSGRIDILKALNGN